MSLITRKKVIIFDGDETYCQFLRGVIGKAGFHASACTRFSEFRQKYQQIKFDIIFLDVDLQEETGLQLLEFLAEQNAQQPIYLLGEASSQILKTIRRLAIGLGLYVEKVLKKPVSQMEIKTALQSTAGVEDFILTEANLRDAIDTGHIRPHFQPQLNTLTGRIDGFEALARWQLTTGEMIMPSSFIPLAENKDLVKSMTISMLEQSCQSLKNWLNRGYSFNVSVNVSAYCLDQNFATKVIRLAQQHKIPSNLITLEVTESVAVANSSEIGSVLKHLSDYGFNLSIDDFGTGYSSLVALHQLPFNELKIDSSFVANMGADKHARIITQSLIELAHNLSLTVCAEGVETPSALQDLTAMGCDLAQGFHISRALKMDQTLLWVRQYHNDNKATNLFDPILAKA